MPDDSSRPSREPSAREVELLDAAYGYVLEHGLSDLSLRPLAGAIGSSPRVLLFLFGSKEGLIRRVLSRARHEEVAWLEQYADQAHDRSTTVQQVWRWLSAPKHDRLLRLWVETYGRSLVDPDGPWSSFAQDTVTDWLELLGGADADSTLALAVLRGALLDLLATGDRERAGAAIDRFAAMVHTG